MKKSLIQHCERSELRLHLSRKNSQFGEFLKTWSLRSDIVTNQAKFKMTKAGQKCLNPKIQMRHFSSIFNLSIWTFLHFWTGCKCIQCIILMWATVFQRSLLWSVHHHFKGLKARMMDVLTSIRVDCSYTTTTFER